ncbi:MAG TPA: tetratricopeptide repeat protein [Planctomycetota bacterium]|jgi:lipoprotein NlpI|nr:tetratricopeptide repeat protein [Planctomycetota bacterium]
MISLSLPLSLALALALADDPPLSAEKRAELAKDLDAAIERHSAALQANPRSLEAYSQRGDAYFKRGHFAQAADDFEKMVELDPTLAAGHWRRGIALFYAGRYEKAARQFEIYHTQDDVDRENGIWRYFSQYKAFGKEKAQAGLLKYQKDDREPFPAVYQLFEGKLTPEQVLSKIEEAKLSAEEKEQRLFYAHLYIGISHAVEGRPREAELFLRKAVRNTWAPGSGYGPDWMWHVGRVHYDLIHDAKKD